MDAVKKLSDRANCRDQKERGGCRRAYNKIEKA